jgi:cyclase
VLALTLAAPAGGQAVAAVEVAPGVFVRDLNPAANQVFIEFDEFVVVFDAGGVVEARILQKEIADRVAKPVRYVVDSHFHPDHSAGAAVFAAAGVEIVAAEAARGDFEGWAREDFASKIAADPETYRGLTYSPPTRYVQERWEIDDGTQRLELLHFGHGHTSGDLVGWLPRQRVLLPGDLSTNGQHNLANASVSGWIAVLERLRALQPGQVVPGHRDMAGPEILEKSHRYLTTLRAEVSRMVGQGLRYEEVLAEIEIPMYREWSGVAVSDESTHVLRAFLEAGGELDAPSLLTRRRAAGLGLIALLGVGAIAYWRRRRARV